MVEEGDHKRRSQVLDHANNVSSLNHQVSQKAIVLPLKKSDTYSCFFFPFPREEDDPSHCAVPISTSLIKQIATKIHPGGTVSQILDEFYGPEKSLQPMWPYNKKDPDR